MDAHAAGLMVFGLAVLAFLANMHRDVRGLRRDMSVLRGKVSRIEGMLAGAGIKAGSDPAFGRPPGRARA